VNDLRSSLEIVVVTGISGKALQAKLLRDEALVLVDTLPPSAYRKGHLPGAINILSDDILEQAPRCLPNRDAQIVVYCANGPCRRSERAAERLMRLGYSNVRDYHEGKADWVAAGLPLETGEEVGVLPPNDRPGA